MNAFLMLEGHFQHVKYQCHGFLGMQLMNIKVQNKVVLFCDDFLLFVVALTQIAVSWNDLETWNMAQKP